MDWSEKIKEVAQAKGLSLRQLAKEIAISHVYLCEVARKAKPASPLLRLKILRAAGVPFIPENLLLLLPDDVLAELRDTQSETDDREKLKQISALNTSRKPKAR